MRYIDYTKVKKCQDEQGEVETDTRVFTHMLLYSVCVSVHTIHNIGIVYLMLHRH